MISPESLPTIYIKAFNRPFVLERCLRSIERYASGHGRVIVLDDGTLDPYIERIRALFPTVEYRFARHASIRYDVVRRKLDRVQMGLDDPSALWIRALRDDVSDYTLIMEEDCWFAHPVDISAIAAEMRARQTLMCKFFWATGTQLRARPDEIFEQLDLPGGQVMNFYLPQPSMRLLDMVKIFVVANQLFRRDYWLAALETLAVWNDEMTQLHNARRFIDRQSEAGLTATFAELHPEPIRHSWSSTSTSLDFDPCLINDIFNEAWLAGLFDPMENFPFDLPEAYLLALLTDVAPAAEIAAWQRWRLASRNTYAAYGSDISQLFF